MSTETTIDKTQDVKYYTKLVAVQPVSVRYSVYKDKPIMAIGGEWKPLQAGKEKWNNVLDNIESVYKFCGRTPAVVSETPTTPITK